MKQRSLAILVLFLILAASCLPALATAEGELALTSASGYEDGFVLSASGLTQNVTEEPNSLSILYIPHAQGAQEETDLLHADSVQKVPVTLPLDANSAIVLTGLTLAPGSSYRIQLEALYGNDPVAVLSNVAAADIAQGNVPTAPASIAFVNKTETIFEGQTLIRRSDARRVRRKRNF